MQFCQPHWDELRAAINERGLNHLVSKDSREAALRQAKVNEDKTNFDPLLSSYMMIVENYIKVFGISGVLIQACPLCFLDKCQEKAPPNNTAKDWIKFASDASLEFAKKNGLQG